VKQRTGVLPNVLETLEQETFQLCGVSPTTPDRISVVIGGTTIDSDSSTVALSKANRKEARGIAKPKEKEARGNSKPNSRKKKCNVHRINIPEVKGGYSTAEGKKNTNNVHSFEIVKVKG